MFPTQLAPETFRFGDFEVDVVAHSFPKVSPALLAAPERLPDTGRHNLPAELTSFVGRRKELLELPRVLASSRLLSMTGPEALEKRGWRCGSRVIW